MATITQKTTTTQLTKPMICKECGAAHFEYHLICKRCQSYFNQDDMSHKVNPAMAVIAILVLVGIAGAVCLAMGVHLF